MKANPVFQGRVFQGRARFLCGWFVLSLAVLLPTRARAFDTGHHADMTRNAMLEFGFSQDAIDTAVLNNWLVDFYSAPPDVGFEATASLLHCDNLFTTSQLRNYMARIAINTRTWTKQAARNNDPLLLLTFLGESLHTVQDLYAHSNWVETHPQRGGGYRVTTWFDCIPDDTGPALFTGYYPGPNIGPQPPGTVPHGDYFTGLNHDSYVRPGWDSAYVFAYVATRNWLSAIQTWVEEERPGFWNTILAFRHIPADRTALDFDLLASYRISEWVGDFMFTIIGADGHWKGNRSGSAPRFLPIYTTWTLSTDSIVVSTFKANFGLLTLGLTNNTPPANPVPDVPAIPLSQQLIMLRTLHVARTDPGLIVKDYFAAVTIGSQQYIEATQMSLDSFNSPWTAIKFVPNRAGTPYLVSYLLWDESSVDALPPFPMADTFNPIQPSGSPLVFSFTTGAEVCAGDVTGVHNSPATSFTTSFPGTLFAPGGEVELFITNRPMEEPALDISSQIAFTRTGLVWNRADGLYYGKIILTNIGDRQLTGPLIIQLKNLVSGYTLVNRDGSCFDGPYKTKADAALNPGEKIEIPIVLSRATNAVVDYRLRVLEGVF